MNKIHKRFCLYLFFAAVLALLSSFPVSAQSAEDSQSAEGDKAAECCCCDNCEKCVALDYVFDGVGGADTLRIVAFDAQRHLLKAQLVQPKVEAMDKNEAGQHIARVRVPRNAWKLYFVLTDDHDILTQIRGIASLDLAAVSGTCAIDERQTYDLALPKISTDKEKLAVGETFTVSVAFEDGYLQAVPKSGNYEILAACEHPCPGLLSGNDSSFCAVSKGENVVHVFLILGDEQVFASCSKVIVVH